MTGQEVFDIAMSLMDNKDPEDYELCSTEYRPRALDILNLLCPELYPYGSTFEGDGRPFPSAMTNIAQTVPLDESIARTVLPYGLAAHLFLTEDPNTAAFFQQRYEEGRSRIARGWPRDWESIDDAYGIEYNDYGSW
jgi:hypothetical protein